MRNLSAPEIEKFKTWLTKNGAIVEPPTNEWEVIRVNTCFGVLVAYRNAKGEHTWPEKLDELHAIAKTRQSVALSPERKSKMQLRHKVEALAARDGLWCWFCEVGFLDADSAEITIEHVCARAHGGPNHASNLVLACKSCNNEAGNWSVAEKVAMRDRKRGK